MSKGNKVKTPSKLTLSVIVNVYNMQREAPRTLHTLSADYQVGISSDEYEVIVVENGSSMPLDPLTVTQFGKNFSYHYEKTDSPSPCQALNRAVARANSDNVVLMIDGARMLSPNVLSLMQSALKHHNHILAYTLILHLGHERQNANMRKGYNQEAEDALLASIDWKNNGYELFDIASLGGSSSEGYTANSSESGCFMVKKSDFVEMGGYDERFVSLGGGLASVDLFRRFYQRTDIEPLLLLGEGTFHQFHGGAVTNATNQKGVWKLLADEYHAIRGEDFKKQTYTQTHIGTINEKAKRFWSP